MAHWLLPVDGAPSELAKAARFVAKKAEPPKPKPRPKKLLERIDASSARDGSD